MRNMTTNENRRSLLILAAGAIVGIMMAAAGFIDLTGKREFSEDIIAKVNDKYINKEKYNAILNGLATDKRAKITDKDRAYVLERLIEEELLVQRGIELGLLDSDIVVRSNIVQSMIASVIAEVAGEEISESKLKSFYKENVDFFVVPDRLHVRQVVFRASTGNDNKEDGFEKALIRASKAFDEFEKGIPYYTVLKRYGDATAIDIPNTLLPPAKLREYIGPTLLKASMTLQSGQISKPIKTSGGYRILIMVDRKNQKEQNFDTIKKEVEAEYRKQRDDRALREYIERLKDWADIKRAEI